MRKTHLAVLGALCFAACGETTEASSEAPTSAPSRTTSLGLKLDEQKFELVADGVYEGPAIAVADVLADPDAFASGSSLRLEGEIIRVCKEKGCWFDIGTREEVIHVTFQGECDRYVPLDAAGRRVLVEGGLSEWKPSAEEEAHLREDAGVAEGETEPVVVLKFVATGAALPK